MPGCGSVSGTLVRTDVRTEAAGMLPRQGSVSRRPGTVSWQPLRADHSSRFSARAANDDARERGHGRLGGPEAANAGPAWVPWCPPVSRSLSSRGRSSEAGQPVAARDHGSTLLGPRSNTAWTIWRCRCSGAVRRSMKGMETGSGQRDRPLAPSPSSPLLFTGFAEGVVDDAC
jgi:hypothetical protein